MNVIPAIDLAGGRVVRLLKGDFLRETVYDDDPRAVARRFRAAGAGRLHVVDLDGARRGESRQTDTIRALCEEGPPVQVGGGLRDAGAVARAFEAGARRVVLGSLAVSDPGLTRRIVESYGGARVLLALDCRLDAAGVPRVATHGWKRVAEMAVDEVLSSYLEKGLESGVEEVLCTDVDRDGTLAGPNVELYRRLVRSFPSVRVIASGGVRELRDLEALAGAGCAGAIVGRALYDGSLRLEEALGEGQASC